MREIPCISRKYQGHVALVDDVDYPLVSQYRWNLISRPNELFHARARINGVWVLMHRFILGASPLDPQVDHWDHNGLHNWRSNIRFATSSQNQANRRPNINGTSSFKGVSFFKRTGKWEVQVHLNGNKSRLGYFTSEIEAAQAYNEFAIQHHGEFACLNDIPESL